MRKMSWVMVVVMLALGPNAGAEPPAKEPAKDTKKKKRRAKKRKKMSRAQVRAHNADLFSRLGHNLPPRDFEWKYIVIHHTASEWSSLERIDRYHRQKFEDPDGIEYHFLIGNGKKRPEGFIELGRWKLQKLAIHLFKPEGAPQAIAISLVGNLHERKIRPAQYEALRDLVVELARRHKIPPERITTHTRVDGRLTVCPGRHFPFKRLQKDVSAALAAPSEKPSKQP